MRGNTLRLLRFLLKYPNSWHSIGSDSRRASKRLSDIGLAEYDTATKQARLAISREG